MITIVIPVSRGTFLEQLFASLEFLEVPKDTNLLTYVDSDHRLFDKVRNYTVNSKFKDRLCVFRGKGLPSTSSIKRRRQRIADVHNEMKDLIQACDYIFMIEDDTIVPGNALSKLMQSYVSHPNAGFISGVELGRWGYLHIGAWKVDDVYDVNEIVSTPLKSTVEKVDAAGFYCCLTKKENYIGHNFLPFEDVLGPDVDYGLTMRRNGLINYVDNSVHCRHLMKKGEVSFEGQNIEQVQFTRDDLSKNGWTLRRVQTK